MHTIYMRSGSKLVLGLIFAVGSSPGVSQGRIGQAWAPLGSKYAKYVTNESLNVDGLFETAIVGYTIPGNLAHVRKVLRRETEKDYTWKTVSHAVHKTKGYDLWIREFEGFRAPGLNPAGPIHVDFSIRRKASFLDQIHRHLGRKP